MCRLKVNRRIFILLKERLNEPQTDTGSILNRIDCVDV